MKIFLIGHRGVGKTSLLRRISQWKLFPENFFDLDEEIEKKFGPLADIFKTQGETSFRQREREVFSELCENNKDAIISLGAGFDVALLPQEDFVLWVRRDSDLKGRIFLNRPRLQKELDPLSEYNERALLREEAFLRRADALYTLPEGLWFSPTIEQKILKEIGPGSLSEKKLGLPVEQLGIETLKYSLNLKKLASGYSEIRSDEWPVEEILKFQHTEGRKIYAHRSPAPPSEKLDPNQWDCLDWDVDCGKIPWAKIEARKLILSTHKNSIESGILQLSKSSQPKGCLLKLCPLIESWQELAQGYRWWAQDPELRSFLPRSRDGRWLWFRLWMKGKQKINFFRQGPVVIPDQPTWYQWESTPFNFQRFGAVLGAPIGHSYSPSFHHQFFSSHQMPFFPIKVTEDEWTAALAFLRELGLSFAAVTSPLKKRAFSSSKAFSDLEKKLESVNTLTWDEKCQEWIGHNTDHQGFEKSFAQACAEVPTIIHDNEILLWGSGGTLNMIKSVRPGIEMVKAREGVDKELKRHSSPRVIIWGTPRTQEVVWPPSDWKPELIFDLNYTSDSMGLELAEKYQTKYFSGLCLFELQAKAQQMIWSNYL